MRSTVRAALATVNTAVVRHVARVADAVALTTVVTLAIVVTLATVATTACAAPILLHRGSIVLDTVPLGGDNDRQPEPGEGFELLLRIGNEGDDDARNISSQLTSMSPLLTVAPGTVSYPPIPPLAQVENNLPGYQLTANASAPCGTPVTMRLRLDYEDSLGTPLTQDLTLLIVLGEPTVLFFEDFDQGPSGWNGDPVASTGSSGSWVNAAPQEYTWMGQIAQPGRDVSWPDVSCFFTGQNLTMTEFENVDGGSQVLSSLDYDLSGQSNVYLSYHRWFYSDDATASDSYEIQASPDSGLNWFTVERLDTSANAWTPVAYQLDPIIALTATVRFRVVTEDGGADSVCEGAIDELSISSYGCAVDPAQGRLRTLGFSIDDGLDPTCSDGDDLADGGETIAFSVDLENVGTDFADNTLATLSGLPAEMTLLSANPVAVGSLADNGGVATASWTLQIADTISCQTSASLAVDATADAPAVGTSASYDLILEEDVAQPIVTWFDDFDSALAPWTVVLYGANNWAPGLEDCAQNPGTPPTPAVNFWFTGSTADQTDCIVTPYTSLLDSAIRSPRIDTGFATPQLRFLRWNQLLTMGLDADAAEIWIDHDDDTVFDLVARYQGQVTTNGDTLDPAEVDLQNNPMMVDLSNATQNVQVEFRFISDATGGGPGPPLALGWIVDNVELEWTDAAGRTCDVTDCAACLATSDVTTARTTICVDEMLLLDGSGDVTNCPAPGMAAFEWLRDGNPFASGPTMITVQEPAIGTYVYRLEVSCTTQLSCSAATEVTIDVIDCPNCVARAEIAPANNLECAGIPVILDARGSATTACPSPGMTTFQWSRNGSPVLPPAGTDPIYTADELIDGLYTYAVEIGCDTDMTCTDVASHDIQFTPNGTPVAVANTVVGRKSAADVELLWTDAQPFANSWTIYRSSDKTMLGLATPDRLTPMHIDPGAIAAPPDRYFYTTRAVSCSGIEGP